MFYFYQPPPLVPSQKPATGQPKNCDELAIFREQDARILGSFSIDDGNGNVNATN